MYSVQIARQESNLAMLEYRTITNNTPPSDRMLDATSATNQFTVDAPTTWVGQKRRACDLHSILVVCTCGHVVSENEIEENEDVIKCKRAGCETGWVSESCKYQLE
jgi:hypothetical protein